MTATRMGMGVVTAEALRRQYAYDPETGEFRRRQQRKGEPSRVGCRVASGYVLIGFGGRSYLAHRLAWLHYYGDWPSAHLCIDHVNGVRDDNRICNLRAATAKENAANKPSTRGDIVGAWIERKGGQ